MEGCGIDNYCNDGRATLGSCEMKNARPRDGRHHHSVGIMHNQEDMCGAPSRGVMNGGGSTGRGTVEHLNTIRRSQHHDGFAVLRRRPAARPAASDAVVGRPDSSGGRVSTGAYGSPTDGLPPTLRTRRRWIDGGASSPAATSAPTWRSYPNTCRSFSRSEPVVHRRWWNWSFKLMMMRSGG